MITFQCDGCQRQLRADEKFAGKKAKCPRCSALTPIPSPVTEDITLPPPVSDSSVENDATLPPETSLSATGIETPTLPPPTLDDPNVAAGRHRTAGPALHTQPLISEAAKLVGEVPGYELIRELGRGGMGVIFLARQLQPRRLVALKMILSGEHAGSDHLARFRTEAEAIARLQHPHIVQIHEVGEHKGRAYLTLEYVDGGNLADYLRDNRLSWTKMADVMIQLAKTVYFAHTQGIIHRDLKPPNVLLTFDEDHRKGNLPFSVKVADFGLAKHLDDMVSVAPEGPMTQTGAILGTPAYMAPEQIEADGQQLGPTVDVYALGVMFYEMLTGKVPFEGESMLDLVLQVATEDPVPPRKRNSKIPRDLETICVKCLQKDPAKRYQSAKELADDLDRYVHGEPILARRQTTAERTLRWFKKRKEIVYLFSGALAVLAIGLAVLFWMQPGVTEKPGPKRPEPLPADLALVPRDSVGFVTIRPKDFEKRRKAIERLLETVLGKENAAKVNKTFVSPVENNLPIKLQDVERVTFVMPTTDFQQVAGILALSKPYDWSAIKTLATLTNTSWKEQTKHGKKLLVTRHGQFICGVNDHVLMWGSKTKLIDILLARPLPDDGPLQETLRKAATSGLLVAGVVPPKKDLADMFGEGIDANAANAVLEAKALLEATDASFVLDLPMEESESGPYFAGIRFEFKITFPDEAKARKAKETVQRMWEAKRYQGRKALAMAGKKLGQAPLLIQKFAVAVEAADWKQQGRTISLSFDHRWNESDLFDLGKWIVEHIQPEPFESPQKIQSKDNLRQLGLAMHAFHDAYKKLPPPAILDKQTRKPLLSWRVQILPYIGEDTLYRKFRLDEPWDSPHNFKLLKEMPSVFRAPTPNHAKIAKGKGSSDPPDKKKFNDVWMSQYSTHYQLVTGPKTLFEKGKNYRLQDITDGTSNTLLIVEAADPVPWTKPQDIRFVNPIAPKLGGVFRKGFHAVMSDGGPVFLSRHTPKQTLQRLIQPNDGKVIDLRPHPKAPSRVPEVKRGK